MSKLKKSLPKEMLNINESLNILSLETLTGAPAKSSLVSFNRQEARSGKEYLRIEALVADAKISFFSNFLQSIILTADEVTALQDAEKSEFAQDLNLYDYKTLVDLKMTKRLHEETIDEDDDEDKSELDLSGFAEFQIIGAFTYGERLVDGSPSKEGHPAIRLAHYTDYDKVLAAKEDNSYVTFKDLLDYNSGKLPALKDEIDGDKPEFWNHTLIISRR